MALNETELNEAETMGVRLIALGRQGTSTSLEQAGNTVIKTVDVLRQLAKQGK